MSKKKRKHPELNKNCYNCNHCQYIGEGGYICDMNNDVVIEDWAFSRTPYADMNP